MLVTGEKSHTSVVALVYSTVTFTVYLKVMTLTACEGHAAKVMMVDRTQHVCLD